MALGQLVQQATDIVREHMLGAVAAAWRVWHGTDGSGGAVSLSDVAVCFATAVVTLAAMILLFRLARFVLDHVGGVWRLAKDAAMVAVLLAVLYVLVPTVTRDRVWDTLAGAWGPPMAARGVDL